MGISEGKRQSQGESFLFPLSARGAGGREIDLWEKLFEDEC